ncbi:MAG: DNA mismatch repair protein MutS [Oscillospiraceae bacterium]
MNPRLLPAPQAAHIDLHACTVFDAEERLILLLEGLPKEVKEEEVVHGYSRGTALKRMVRTGFYHWRVKAWQADLNPGITWLILK